MIGGFSLVLVCWKAGPRARVPYGKGPESVLRPVAVDTAQRVVARGFFDGHLVAKLAAACRISTRSEQRPRQGSLAGQALSSLSRIEATRT